MKYNLKEMQYDDQLILTTKLEILIPRFNEAEKLVTMILGTAQGREAALSTDELVELNLRLAGSSLRGARDSAELILGSRSKAPVMISRKHGMYLIPIKWPGFPVRGWVNKLQVWHYLPKQADITTVVMKSGNVYDVPCSRNVFANSMGKGRNLRSGLDRRDEQIIREAMRTDQAFYVQKDEGLNYEVTDKVFYVAERQKKQY
ncbi:hypothetical protein NCCP2716_30850 [Sporosarcina sp. NCCP-2716]|uniref:competence protein ComK n=1 Tax=Sporosarcina sp. NCCP-2716 TaxID=2943679 RepID=UPI0020412273|nr:competence protein ComK [Sporosarcina sp. NCCP-2716]GKV70587.1 hypothetical protein NCCP2716_30850 [Sporosarcina sp. NCCP-2716]